MKKRNERIDERSRKEGNKKEKNGRIGGHLTHAKYHSLYSLKDRSHPEGPYPVSPASFEASSVDLGSFCDGWCCDNDDFFSLVDRTEPLDAGKTL